VRGIIVHAAVLVAGAMLVCRFAIAAEGAGLYAPARVIGTEEQSRAVSSMIAGGDVARRIDELVPNALRRHFDLYLFISKAEEGPAAQRMFIFTRSKEGDFALEDVWPVSTGREAQEKYFTTTPAGLFKLDPQRFYALVYSQRWNGAPMPYAMFLDYRYRSRASGLAIHAATRSTAPKLGTRASGGCVRLSPEHARLLFDRIQSRHAGQVPDFVFDDAGGTTHRGGMVRRDGSGQPILIDGYRVLVIIDNYAGKLPETARHTGAIPLVQQ
jgi:hypothetical protein